MINDRALAERISHLFLDVGKRLDESVALVQTACSASEFQLYRRAVAEIMGDMLLGVMNPLYAQHPDLKPKELR
jgi:hypothetical protein